MVIHATTHAISQSRATLRPQPRAAGEPFERLSNRAELCPQPSAAGEPLERFVYQALQLSIHAFGINASVAVPLSALAISHEL